MESKIQFSDHGSSDKSFKSRESDISIRDIDQGLEDIECMIKKLQNELIGLQSITYTLAPTHSKNLNTLYSTTKVSKASAYVENYNSTSRDKQKVRICKGKTKNVQVNCSKLNRINYNLQSEDEKEKCDACGAFINNTYNCNTSQMQVLFNKIENSKVTSQSNNKVEDSTTVQKWFNYKTSTILFPMTMDQKTNKDGPKRPKNLNSIKTPTYVVETIETIDDLQKKYSEIYYDCQSTLNLCDILKKHIENMNYLEDDTNKKCGNITVKNMEVRNVKRPNSETPCTVSNENNGNGANIIKTLDEATKAIDEVQKRCSDIWYDCLETLNICKSLKQIKECKSKSETESNICNDNKEKAIQIKIGLPKKKKERVTATATQIKIDKPCKCKKKNLTASEHRNNNKGKLDIMNIKVDAAQNVKNISINEDRHEPNSSVLRHEKTRIKERFKQNHNVPVSRQLAQKVYTITEESTDDYSGQSVDSFKPNIDEMKQQGSHLVYEEGDNDIEIQYLYEEENEKINEKLDVE